MPSLNLSVALAAMLGSLAICWSPAVRAQDAERSVSVQGRERAYLLHVPPGLSGSAPLVMVFHGGGGRPEAIERVTGMDELSDRNGFIVVYPAGEPGPSGRGGTWTVGGGYPGSGADDVAFVRAILRDVEASVPVDRSRVYAAGHSMGGVFAYRLACEMSGTFAAVSATMVEPACRPGSPVAVLHIHGTADDRIPLEGGRGELTARNRSWPAPSRGIATWRRIDGCSGPPTEGADGCRTESQCSAPVTFCVIPGGTHPWPSGAADRIWAFFAARST